MSDYLIHIPNGGYRHPREAKKLKKMGVKAGVSDLLLAYPNDYYHGLWIELKSPKGKLSSEQKEWLNRMKAVDYSACVSYSLEETFDILQTYFNGL